MATLAEIYYGVEKHSLLIQKGEEWTEKALNTAKNYVCTPDLKHWTFAKTLLEEENLAFGFYGSGAKPKLYQHGFVNILEALEEGKKKNAIIQAFLKWAKDVPYPIATKFEKKIESSSSFELLVHVEVLAAMEG